MDAALIVLDGWGIATHDRRNAVEAATTPAFDELWTRGASGTLDPTGSAVGLPPNRAGNSEVGHLTIGAGRAVNQPLTKISDAIGSGTLRDNSALAGAYRHAEATGGRLHLLGLLSTGGVHAEFDHLAALIRWAGDADVDAVTHAFTDGRDMDPTSALGLVTSLESVVDEVGTGAVGTVVGRYFAMDRDGNWDRTKRAYEAIVDRAAPHRAESGVAAVEDAYARDETDEFIEPTVIADRPGIADGDAAIFLNFRGDRARQLVRVLATIRPEWPFDVSPPDISLVTMTEYDRTFDLPVAFRQPQPEHTVGEVLATAGRTQLRVAESEKYAHVTYFFNGGREVEFTGEYRRIVPSPDVPTYDLQPEMNATGVTETALTVVEEEDPAVLVLNYANPDMVGHTGNYEATIAAVEAVDAELDRLVTALTDRNAHVLVTADHGNADDLGTEATPNTAHTANPVPFVYLDPQGTDGGFRIRSGGELKDIAPTLLDCIDIDRPAVMTGRSLLGTQ